jgi:hypothetical protein
MKQFFFYAALILAFIAIFVGVLVTTEPSPATPRTRWLGINVFAVAFFFWLLSMAPFIHD